VRRRGEGLRCPSSWASYLREDGRTLLETDHPLGRCRRCDSVRPRARHGGLPVCIDCGAGMPGQADPDVAAQHPDVPSEHGRARQRDDLPAPPTGDELEHVDAPIRAAIKANVFLQGLDHDQPWSGSGIVVARDGDHIAILTNRHVVEGPGQRPSALRAMTVAGETTRTTTIWRARRGVDLALVEARVARPGDLAVMSLGTGAALVGVEVFAIGNPLGLAWSYTAGTLSAVRHWRTQEGQAIRILQTDTDIGPGSSGGGLFHRDGHLLGIMTFSATGSAGGSAHFAISVDAIRTALTDEGVTWRGLSLTAPPASPPREA
jgi:S1-C subfamily serine protease